jgi:fumarylpyruvate hydrolase
MLSVIQNPPRIALPIAGSSDLFPVRRVYCVGRNYAAHAREMGADPDREPPFFFMKPADALQLVGPEPAPHTYPPQTQNYHFEVELVAALAGGGSDIPMETALDHVYGYAIGLDMTRRDLQDEAKKLSRPWDLGKAADSSGPIGALFPASAITLAVNGEIRQKGDLADMIWSVAEQVAYLSRYFTLQPGDLIFTGTPSGVGPVQHGERMVAAIAGLGEITLDVV